MKKLFFGAILLPLLAGCALFTGRNYVEPHDYDLTLTSKPEIDKKLVVGAFRNLSGTDRRFLFREADGEILTDDYNRWILPVDQLLARKFYEQFAAEEQKKESVRLTGTIYRFEFNRPTGKATLAVIYKLRLPDASGELSGSFRTEEPIRGEGGANCAAAMSRCMDRLLEQIAAEINRSK